MSRSYIACVEGNEDDSSQVSSLQIMAPTGLFTALDSLATAYEEATGTAVDIVPVDESQLLLEVLFEYTNNLTTMHDAWIIYLDDGYYQLEQAGAMMDLTNLTAASDAAGYRGTPAQWYEVPYALQRLALSYDNVRPPPNTVAVPHHWAMPIDGSVPLMYYRKDVFARFNLTAPRTWSEVLYISSILNNTNFDDDDDTFEQAVCFKPDPDCTYASALGMVLAPYLQYGGTAQGGFLQPEDLLPLFGNEGAVEALRVYGQLLRYHTPLAVEGEECTYGRAARSFALGDCYMAFGWGDVFKMAELGVGGGPLFVKGRYDVAALPGSEEVWDRTLQQRVPCTAARCPLGLGGQPELISRLQDGAAVYVNRAAYLPYGGMAGVVGSAVSPERQRAAFGFLSYVSNANLNLSLSADNMIVPFRSDALSPSRLPDFVAAGFDAAPTAAYMAAVSATLAHPNLVPGPVIMRVEALRALVDVASANLSAGMAPAAVGSLLQAQVEEQVLDYEAGWGWRQSLKAAYWAWTGYTPPASNSTGSGGGAEDVEMPAVSLAVPVASAVVVLLLSTLYEFRKHRQHRSLFGKVVAPGPFEDTTLLVTDIQDSTALWETLPSAVMDRAIKEHHSCLRRLLLKHNGYESATEGDSFLLAFHCPEDALLFAMEAQVALLECAWPMELLDCDVCRPAYVVHNDGDKRAGLLADGGDAAGGLMALPRANSSLSHKSTSEEASSPQASNALGASGASGGTSEVNTFLTACQASWKEANATTPNNVLIFRGLRVRMGMHAGISNEADVAYNKAAARMQYSGEILQYAKSVGDAAAGGMILLSEATYRRLPMERLWDKAMVMHVGEYKLKDDLPVLPLYQVTGRRLMGRLGYLSGMRFKEQLSKGVFTAPLGAVAMAFTGVVGVPTLLAWDEPMTREALGLLAASVGEQVVRHNGYLVEAGEQQIHAVFPSAADALLFSLAAHQALMEVAWPEPLLDHELAEELIVGDAVVFRGIRVKTGVDVGHAVGEVNALTGRICYRGKVVARSARISQNASSNQVLCSGEAWAAAMAGAAGPLQLRGVVGDRLGPFKLRGVAEKVEVVQVRLQRHDVAGAEGWAQDLHGGEGGAAADASAGGGGGSAPHSRPESRNITGLGPDGGGGGEGGGGVLSPSGSRPFAFLSRAVGLATASAGGDDAKALSGSALPSSPRRFSGLLRSVRTQSFSAASGLIHRMAHKAKGPARAMTTGVAPEASSGGGGAGEPSGSGSGGHSPGGSTPASGAATPLAGVGSGGGAAAAAVASGSLSPVRAASVGSQHGLFRGLRGTPPSRGQSPLAQAAGSPSARRLLPGWGPGGGGALGSPIAGGQAPMGRASDASDISTMVATSLPVSRPSHPHVGAASDGQGDAGAGGGEGAGAGGEAAGAGGHGGGTEGGEGPGWVPGEMLGEALAGVVEEDESARISDRASLVAALR
ncbi:hypothetical protein HYH03_000056 [Edaphochlamys debaryana]|uniref:Guanylate cyclase domain-containing protein n=1 Tax=Edaphochlamys debaryana TaxID=47281 RepID=A0A836C725_9CHLO|nr:hypothetical protein HYH03_000056 [Edaphochlamys debaryana]|eukprot:KAG2501549.1 hypothetical protein HYH03_000056 [Edaphochlamys debaryana]